MKKFTNAVIYGHDDANEILVDNGVIKAIGKELGAADEVIQIGTDMAIYHLREYLINVWRKE